MNLATDVSARLTTRIVKVIMSTGRLTTRIVKVITSTGRKITRTVSVFTGTIRTGTCTERKANAIAHTFCSRTNHGLSQSSKKSVQAIATKIAMTGTYLPA
jgi:hypothetical protein